MGEVVTLSCEARLDLAWRDYRATAMRAVDDPKLLLDRDFFDEYVRLEDRYKRQLLAMERGR